MERGWALEKWKEVFPVPVLLGFLLCFRVDEECRILQSIIIEVSMLLIQCSWKQYNLLWGRNNTVLVIKKLFNYNSNIE